ncbi:hypothetical protein MCOR02_007047, partial [Pyricularia oryzae]
WAQQTPGPAGKMIAKSISKRSLLMEPQSGKQCDLGQACGTSNVTMASQLLRRHNYLVPGKGLIHRLDRPEIHVRPGANFPAERFSPGQIIENR